MKSFATVLAVAAGIGEASSVTADPLGQVVSLLEKLAGQVDEDAAAEEHAYKAFFEWCDEMAKNTGFAIDSSAARKNKLEAAIGKLSADIEVADSKISELAASLSTSASELKSSKAVRASESADFAASEKELTEVLDSLARASDVLEREMQKNGAAFAQVSGKGMAAVVQSITALVDAAAFSVADKSRLLALVQAQQGSDEDEKQGSEQEDKEYAEAFGAPAAAGYASHSGSIFDVLADLKDKTESQLSDLRESEVKARHNYEMLAQALEDQSAVDTADMANQKAAKAASEESKSTSEGDLAVVTSDLKSAKTSLAKNQGKCMTIAASYEATVRARAEELKVLKEGIKVLESTTSGAVEQTYSLVQVSSHAQAERQQSQVVSLVKKLARQYHSSALQQLASRLTVAGRYSANLGQDPFAKVRDLIEGMIAKLNNQASSEAEEKEFCDKETAKTLASKDELSTVLAKTATKIDTSAARSAALKEEVRELQAELATLAEQFAASTKWRQESHAAFVHASADIEQGLLGVRKALIVLREYYAAEDDASDTAFVQHADTSFMQQPEPPALKGHEKSSGTATNIIGILEICENDFATNLAKETTQEQDGAELYESLKQETALTEAEKAQSVKYLTQEFLALDKSISELEGDRQGTATQLGAVQEYESKLNSRCIAKPEAYEERKKRRDQEIAGLKEALDVLENEAAFVQRGSNLRGSNKNADSLLPGAFQ